MSQVPDFDVVFAHFGRGIASAARKAEGDPRGLDGAAWLAYQTAKANYDPARRVPFFAFFWRHFTGALRSNLAKNPLPGRCLVHDAGIGSHDEDDITALALVAEATDFDEFVDRLELEALMDERAAGLVGQDVGTMSAKLILSGEETTFAGCAKRLLCNESAVRQGVLKFLKSDTRQGDFFMGAAA